MKIPQKKDLIKISDYIWEIPKEFRSDMKVPARIFASEEILEELFKDRSLWQLVNMTTLPGIYKYALAMPDVHEGYGACVGGIAAFDLNEGIISPGAIGYDINCLHSETLVNLNFGTYLKIKDIKNKFELPLLDKAEKKLIISKIALLLKRKENKKLLEIKTRFGNKILATFDHPFYTPTKMKKADELVIGEKLIAYPFKGIKYEKPKRKLIVDEKKFIQFCKKLKIDNSGNRMKQIIKFLREKELLPLYLDSPQTPYLIKIIGYSLGDGHLDKNYLVICGRKEDLIKIQKDLEKIKIDSLIVHRKRNHKIKTYYEKIYEFTHNEYCLRINSTAFCLLLTHLGLPFGNKNKIKFNVPHWIKNSVLWHKRLFLASFFGAKLSSPDTVNKFNLRALTLNINKEKDKIKDGFQFLKEIKNLLKEFSIKTSEIKIMENLGIGNKKVGLRFQIKSELKNLIKFFEAIGFEYNKEKQKLNNLALSYLKYKENIINQRKKIREKIKILSFGGVKFRELVKTFAGNFINERFIKRSRWEEAKDVKIAFNFPSFDKFIENYAFGNDGFVIDEIEKIKEINYKGDVYDLTIADENHNFIANNFVVSNCGVRLLVSPFFYDEIKDKITKLTEQIFKEVPSGVGRGGFYNLNKNEMDLVLNEGTKWVVNKLGFGTQEDLISTESEGKIEGADPDKVSKNAKERGSDQLGTIGAGNHFVEVQKVTEVFDEKIAKILGLEKNKVTVLIHCGSRGLGHQIATDYIRLALNYLDKKNIELVDRELAYFPFESPEGKNYLSAMKAAANFAFANRQLITYEVRKAFKKIFGKEIELKQVYDVAHNIAKIEEYNGKKLIVHRKGATRSFPPKHNEIHQKYQAIGQPTLIPGSMGTSSYVLVGQKLAMKLSFGSSPHGAGRIMSRTEAKKKIRGSELKKELEARGIAIAAGSMPGLAEEAPVAYKNISQIVEVVHNIGIAKKVIKLAPIGVIKG